MVTMNSDRRLICRLAEVVARALRIMGEIAEDPLSSIIITAARARLCNGRLCLTRAVLLFDAKIDRLASYLLLRSRRPA